MKKLLCFIAGFGLGSYVTYRFLNEKYSEQAQEEIDSVVETFKKEKERLTEIHDDVVERHNKFHIESEKEAEDILNEHEKEENKEIIEKVGYATEPETEDEIVTNIIKNSNSKKPEIIDENEYGETGYQEITLMYTDDGILVDEEDSKINDPEEFVGDALEEFDDITIERVYVRDYANEADYLILRSEKSFKELFGEEET